MATERWRSAEQEDTNGRRGHIPIVQSILREVQ